MVLRDIAFSPARLAVPRGTAVTWRWQDGTITHNVRSTGRLRFRGSSSKQTGTHTIRLTRRGLYRYACTLHPGMTGTVRVR